MPTRPGHEDSPATSSPDARLLRFRERDAAPIHSVPGVVIGHDFYEVGTEARAESGEPAARNTTADLRRATEGRHE
jgi:hypothetical protein